VARSITHNTIVVVASAPGFPHGVVDDVEGIAAAAAKRGVLCHVDACLGGYLLPFVEQLGYDVPKFDLRVPGVRYLRRPFMPAHCTLDRQALSRCLA
jgi:sphinganine-1-phosphate aldolase